MSKDIILNFKGDVNMAEKFIKICDKCGKEEIVKSAYDTPKDWKQVSIKVSGGSYSELTLRNCLLCTDCLAKLGIVTPEKPTLAECHSLADQLYEAIAQIVQENQNN